MKFIAFDSKQVAVEAIESFGTVNAGDKVAVTLTTRGGRILREDAPDQAAADARVAELVQQAGAA